MYRAWESWEFICMRMSRDRKIPVHGKSEASSRWLGRTGKALTLLVSLERGNEFNCDDYLSRGLQTMMQFNDSVSILSLLFSMGKLSIAHALCSVGGSFQNCCSWQTWSFIETKPITSHTIVHVIGKHFCKSTVDIEFWLIY